MEIYIPMLYMALLYVGGPVLIIIGFLKLYNTFKASVRMREEQNEIFRELVTHLKSKNENL